MRIPGVILLLLAMFARTAAGQPEKPEFLGKSRPEAAPKRVVSLAPNLTEILFALGVGERVVGVTTYDDYPEAVRKLPRVGGFIDPSLEAILALKPDLTVCVPNSGGKNRMQTLSRMGVPVLVLPSYRLEDIFQAIEKLGEIFGRKPKARELTKDMRGRIEAVRERVRNASRPKVLLVYGHRPLVAAGRGSFADSLLTIAGGENVLGKSKVRYPTIAMEEVIRLAPEIVIDASASGSGAEMTQAEVNKTWSRWKVLPAVKAGRIHIFDSALWFRPGPRIVQGL
jgi:iron complex transport system substrate-binding protein